MKSTVLFLLSMCMLAMSGCNADTNAETLPSHMSFDELNASSYTENGLFTKKQIKIIKTQAEYNAGLIIYSNNTPENINFSEGQVLLVDMGERNSGGYSIKVTSVEESKNYVLTRVELGKPGKNCVVDGALTNPFQFVYIPTHKEILITESLSILECN